MIYLYGASTQTCKLSDEANSLNYALAGIDKGSVILGFKHVQGEYARYMSHVVCNGLHFTLCFAKKDTKTRRWESDEWEKAEQELIDAGYVWLVCLSGSDDHTGYTRFKSLEDAKKWFVSDESIDYSDDKYWMVN